MCPQKLHLEMRGYDDLSRGLSCLFLKSCLYQNQPWEHSGVKVTDVFCSSVGFDSMVSISWCHIATHAHSALSMLQLPYRHLTLCIPPRRVLCYVCFSVCFAILIFNLLLDLFLYGSSESLLCVTKYDLLPYCNNFISLLFIV